MKTHFETSKMILKCHFIDYNGPKLKGYTYQVVNPMKKWNLKAILGGDFCEVSGGREQCFSPGVVVGNYPWWSGNHRRPAKLKHGAPLITTHMFPSHTHCNPEVTGFLHVD